MITKSWNIRDQTEKELTELLEKKYKEIDLLRGEDVFRHPGRQVYSSRGVIDS